MAMEKKIRDAFAAFDENQSGFLDSKKLRNALRLYGIRLDRPEVEQVLRAYDDQTRDGKLQLSEFSVLIRDLDGGIIRKQALSDDAIRRQSSLDPQQHQQGSGARLPSTLDQSSILRWSAQRREEEAAQLRTLDRSLRDEALAEQLLSEQASPPLIDS